MYTVIKNNTINSKLNIHDKITNKDLWQLLETNNKMDIYYLSDDGIIKDVFAKYLKLDNNSYELFSNIGNSSSRLQRVIKQVPNKYITLDGKKINHNMKLRIVGMTTLNAEVITIKELYNFYKNYPNYIIYIEDKPYCNMDYKGNKLILSDNYNNRQVIECKKSNKEVYDYILS